MKRQATSYCLYLIWTSKFKAVVCAKDVKQAIEVSGAKCDGDTFYRYLGQADAAEKKGIVLKTTNKKGKSK